MCNIKYNCTFAVLMFVGWGYKERLFQGEVISYNNPSVSPQVSKSINADDTIRKWISMRSGYDVVTSEQEYWIAFREITVDTAFSNNVGVYSIYIMNEKDTTFVRTFWGIVYSPRKNVHPRRDTHFCGDPSAPQNARVRATG